MTLKEIREHNRLGEHCISDSGEISYLLTLVDELAGAITQREQTPMRDKLRCFDSQCIDLREKTIHTRACQVSREALARLDAEDAHHE